MVQGQSCQHTQLLNLCSLVTAAYEAKYSKRSIKKYALISDSDKPVTKPANHYPHTSRDSKSPVCWIFCGGGSSYQGPRRFGDSQLMQGRQTTERQTNIADTRPNQWKQNATNSHRMLMKWTFIAGGDPRSIEYHLSDSPRYCSHS